MFVLRMDFVIVKYCLDWFMIIVRVFIILVGEEIFEWWQCVDDDCDSVFDNGLCSI